MTQSVVPKVADVFFSTSASSEPGKLKKKYKATVNKASLAFFHSIETHDLNLLCFLETLTTLSESDQELGQFVIGIETGKYLNEDCYLVHANSQGNVDNVPCGTTIQTFVSKNLETLDEQIAEYVKISPVPIYRKTVINLQDDIMHVNRILTQGEQVTERSSHSFQKVDMQGFISEGANLLLQRLLMLKGIPDSLECLSFDHDLNLCLCKYKGMEDRIHTIANVEMRSLGIKRTIYLHTEGFLVWEAYYSEDCRLVTRKEIGSPIKVELQKLPAVLRKMSESVKALPDKQPLNWEDDVQLYSKFMDRKEQLKSEHTSYVNHHPELKDLLGDFLQFLLIRKPEDVLSFAAEYFSSFTVNTAP